MDKMEDYEFVVKKSDPKTAKQRFLKKVNSRTGFAKTVYDTEKKLNLFDGCGTKDQLIASGMSNTWFTVYCNVCRMSHEKVVTFDVNGGEYDYDICADCLRGALLALAKA
jgi:hypothetical protein